MENPSVVLARDAFEKARREYNEIQRAVPKAPPMERSVSAARYVAAKLELEAGVAQAAADLARKLADDASRDVEVAEAAAAKEAEELAAEAANAAKAAKESKTAK